MRAWIILALLIVACGDARTTERDAELEADAERPWDAGSDAAGAPGDASVLDAESSGADAGSFLTMPAFDDAAAPDACNRVLNDAPQIETLHVADSLPDVAGGVIADGVYERVVVRHFNSAGDDAGASAGGDRAVLWLTGGEFHISQTLVGGGAQDHVSGTIETQGTRLILTRRCPLPELVSPYDQFEASERELTFSSSSLERTITYRRR